MAEINYINGYEIADAKAREDITSLISDVSANTTAINNEEDTRQEMDISLQNQITSLASGSPAGVYSTVSALTTADPDHDKIYLVTADGKWYYYDISQTDWVAGGTYQGTTNENFDKKVIPIYGGIISAEIGNNNIYTFSHSDIFIYYRDKTFTIPADTVTLDNRYQAYCIDMDDVYNASESGTLTPIKVSYSVLASPSNQSYKTIFADFYGKIKTDLTLQFMNFNSLNRLLFNKLNLIPFSQYSNNTKINTIGNTIKMENDLLLFGLKGLYLSSVNCLQIKAFELTINPFEIIYIKISEIPVNGVITNELLHHSVYYAGSYNIKDIIPLFYHDNNGNIRCLYNYDIINKKDNILWLGDSISSLSDISKYIKNYNINNCAFPGGSLTIGPGSYYNALSILNISESIKNNDYTDMETAVEYFEEAQSGSATIMRHNLTTLENLDFTKINKVVIFAGTNDFGQALCIMGSSINSSNTDFKGYFAKVIENLESVMPSAQFYIVTPVYRETANTPNSRSYVLSDYVDAIKEVAAYYNIPCKDMYYNSNISALTYGTFLTSDGLHPNETGRALIGSKIEKFIDSN